MSEVELRAREEILFENYAKIINIEALTMIDMAKKQIIPAVEEYVLSVAKTAEAKRGLCSEEDCLYVEKELVSKLSKLNAQTYKAVEKLGELEKKVQDIEDTDKRAVAFKDVVIPAMAELRKSVDEMEMLVPKKLWPLPSYGEMTYCQ